MAIAWTGGKDSTTLLHLVSSAYNGDIPFRVINIDTSVKFKEIYDFRDRLSKEWQGTGQRGHYGAAQKPRLFLRRLAIIMKNIILFSIDNLRYDCVGYQPDKTELVRHHSL